MPRSVPRTYAELRAAVEATLLAGQRRIEHAKVLTYWETGWFIKEHFLLKGDRADYGAKIYNQLERDLNVGKRLLYQCAQFARRISIVHDRAQLGWAHYRVLCQVEDDAQRTALLKEAIRKHWTSPELETRVRQLNLLAATDDTADAAAKLERLKFRRGTVGLYPIVDRGDGPVVDLGFMLYRELPSTGLRAGGSAPKLAKGDIVRLDEGGVRRVEGATKVDLFTYAATIRKVIDGDTLLVAIKVAPGYARELKLRLRGLDCPELSTAAGRAAKSFVDGLIKAGDEVIICTTKPDKYDRYLADVFLGQLKGESPKLKDSGGSVSQPSTLNAQLQEGGAFLNNLLLEGGYAVRYDGEAKEV